MLCNVVILAAGISSRMGYAKLLLKLPNGNLILGSLIDLYNSLNFNDVIVVVNPFGYESLKNDYPEIIQRANFIINYYPEKGRKNSLMLGIDASGSDLPIFIHNVDNPFVNNDLILGMYSLLQDNSYVVPVFEEQKGHPVLLSESLIKYLIGNWKKVDRLDHFLNSFSCINYQSHSREILLNINTPEDYKSFVNSCNG